MRLEQQEREEEEPTILASKLSHENGSPQSPPEPLASQKSKALRVESLGPAASEEGRQVARRLFLQPHLETRAETVVLEPVNASGGRS